MQNGSLEFNIVSVRSVGPAICRPEVSGRSIHGSYLRILHEAGFGYVVFEIPVNAYQNPLDVTPCRLNKAKG